MPESVFQYGHMGGNYAIYRDSVGEVWNFPLVSGDVIPASGIVIKKSSFYFSMINHTSSQRQARIDLENVGILGGPFVTNGDSSYGPLAEPCVLTPSMYAGVNSMLIRIRGNGTGGTSGTCFSIRSDCVMTLTVEWEYAYTQCTPPSAVSVSATNVAPGAEVDLQWSGAAPGTNMVIDHYDVYRSVDGGASYQFLKSVYGTSTKVNAPAGNGASYLYKVITVGSVAGYNSGLSAAAATLTCTFTAPSAPSSVSIGGGVEAIAAAGANVVLAWAGAGNGTNNPVIGYRIYQNGVHYADVGAGVSSMNVPAHTTAGQAYTYTVQSLGALASSGQSAGRTVYTYSAPSAPSSVSIGGGAEAFAAAGVNVALAWSGAGNGAYNSITGYRIYRDGVHITDVGAGVSSINVTAHNTAGQAHTYTVQSLGAYASSGLSVGRTVYTYSAPSAPSGVTIGGGSDAYATAGANVALAWSGAGNGEYNPITGYRIYRDGVHYTDVGPGVSSINVPAHNTAGQAYTYTVQALGARASSGLSAGRTVYTYSAPSAPSTVNVSAALQNAGNNVTLSFAGAGAGHYNGIRGYHIYRGTSPSGPATFLEEVLTTAASGSLVVAASNTEGQTYYYWVYTLGNRSNSAISSAYAALITNSTPAAPTAVSASPLIREGESIAVIWSGQTDADGNITQFDIQYAIKLPGGSYGGWVDLGTKSASPFAHNPTLADGTKIKYQVRAVDALGKKSGWTGSNEVTQNSAPEALVILFPGAGKTTYNSRPTVGLSINAEPDGQAQTLYYSVDGGAAQSAGAVTAGTKKLQLPALAIGNRTVRFWLMDSQGVSSGEAAVTITVAANTYTRVKTVGTLLWDEVNGNRTSAEILELKGRVNQVRAFYGLAAISLPYEGAAGANTIKHVHTWMPNMEALYQGLFDTCAVSGAIAPARVTRARNAPSAGVENQVRTMIGSL